MGFLKLFFEYFLTNCFIENKKIKKILKFSRWLPLTVT